MASRVIQFPVRNAFHAQRSQDALARNPEPHTRRIGGMVQAEMERLAVQQSKGERIAFAAARSRNVVMMPGRTRRPAGPRLLSALVGAMLKVTRPR